MPNPLTKSDVPNLTDNTIHIVILKTMPHKGKYTKKETEALKKKDIPPGTKAAHMMEKMDMFKGKKKKKMSSSDGYMYT